MIEEQLISFETAKMAKEKGFDGYFVDVIYDLENNNKLEHVGAFSDKYWAYIPKTMISAPTQSLLQKWLREKHYIFTSVFSGGPESHQPIAHLYDGITMHNDLFEGEVIWFESYEEALEIAEQTGLENIELKTSQEWYDLKKEKEPGFVIYDPDGWDRANYDFSFKEELITKIEFDKRVMQSTIINRIS